MAPVIISLVLVFPLLFDLIDPRGISAESDDPEERLVAFLANASGKTVRPGRMKDGVKSPLLIRLWFSPFRILGLDGHLETISFLAFLTESWEDARLAWNPEDFDGHTSVFVSPGTVWTPRTHVPNLQTLNREDKSETISIRIDSVRTPAGNRSTAVIHLETYAHIQDRCDFVSTYYPFDRQACEICVSATHYDKKHIRYTVSYNSTSTFVGGGEWELERGYVYSDSDAAESMACVELVIRRYYEYYLINLFIPTACICLLNTIGLFASLDGDQPVLDFASMGQTTLLTLSVLLLTVADQTPRGAAEVSLLGIFFLIMMFQTLSAAITAVYLKKWISRSEANRIWNTSEMAKDRQHSSSRWIRRFMTVHILVIIATVVIIIAIGCIHSEYGGW